MGNVQGQVALGILFCLSGKEQLWLGHKAEHPSMPSTSQRVQAALLAYLTSAPYRCPKQDGNLSQEQYRIHEMKKTSEG